MISADDRTARVVALDPSVPERVRLLSETFDARFGAEGERVLAYAPGRAEILGNHTDYNDGYTLSANITRNVLLLARKRDDDRCRVLSLNMTDEVIEFDVPEVQLPDGGNEADRSWVDYVRGVLWSMKRSGLATQGFDAVIESTVPVGAGTSSSAALETAVARTVSALANLEVDAETQVDICKRAENEYVGAPCGYLDQATVGLAEDWLIIDYRESNGRPFAWQPLSADLSGSGFALLVGFDPGSAHELTDGKYGERRKGCEASLDPLRRMLGKLLTALRDVSVAEFASVKDVFEKEMGDRVANFVEHIVNDNERVLQAKTALGEGRLEDFGELMTASGHSAIELYDLAEGAPELRYVYETAVARSSDWGIAGVRNMGGGFTATSLMLVRSDRIDGTRSELSALYESRFGRPYNTIDFVPSPAAGVLNLESLIS